MILESLVETLVRYGDLIITAWILAATFVISKTILFIFRRYILGIKGLPGEELHEHIAAEVKWIFYLAAGTIGTYLAIMSTDLLTGYSSVIKDIYVVFGVLLGAYIARKVINSVIVWYASKDKKIFKIEKTELMSLRGLISVFIVAIAIIMILAHFGVEITPLVASLGIGGIAIALALQPTLSSYFAGLYIASDKTVRIGDYVELDEERRGYVEKMTWRTVWIRTVTDNMIVIPNSKLAESVIINYSQPKRSLLFDVSVGVAYHSDLEKVRKIALKVAKDVAKKTGGHVENEEPFIRFVEFGDSNISLKVLFKIKEWINRYAIRDMCITELKKAFDKEGIEISFPCRNVYMRK